MGMKVGFDQVQKPAPLWMRRVLNALIIIIMPAFTAFVMQTPEAMLHADKKAFIVSAGVFITALIKAIEYVVGDGQPLDERVHFVEERQDEDEKEKGVITETKTL